MKLSSRYNQFLSQTTLPKEKKKYQLIYWHTNRLHILGFYPKKKHCKAIYEKKSQLQFFHCSRKIMFSKLAVYLFYRIIWVQQVTKEVICIIVVINIKYRLFYQVVSLRQ